MYRLVAKVLAKTRSLHGEQSVTLCDIVIDRESVMDQPQAKGNSQEKFHSKGAMLNGGLTLTGKAVLSWTGAAPTQSRLACQVKR